MTRGLSEANPWRNASSFPLNKDKVEGREESRRKLIAVSNK